MAHMKWEQRWHPLRREWVIIAAHRQDRPWSGQTETSETATIPPYVEDCYLCPGNRRVSGQVNDDYRDVFVFDNDHPCVGLNAPGDAAGGPGIYRRSAAQGIARVVCYHPRHDLTLAELPPEGIVTLLQAWQQQYCELGALDPIRHVLIFENKGDVVGVSNPHPHCQIYATNFVFKAIENEAAYSLEHFKETGRTLLGDMIAAEQQDERRILAQNETAIGFIPYCARYAYETFVTPKAAYQSLADLPEAELLDFANVLKEVLVRMDNLWEQSFPYVMALHQAPTDGRNYEGFHFHIEFHPPLRKPNLLKFLAGPEIGGGSFVSDTWPEDKAAELRATSPVHYKHR